MDYESNKSYIEMRSAGMSVASTILGILSLIMCCCIYPAIIFGSLALIFALLSRGGEMTMNSYATAGMILGIIGIVLGILFLIYAFAAVFTEFGGIEGYMKEIENILNDMGYPYPDYPETYDFYNTL